jgi:Short C-terminal domain
MLPFGIQPIHLIPLLCFAVIVLGIVLLIRSLTRGQNRANGAQLVTPGSVIPSQPDDKLQALTQLKGMLDAGLITQDEFNTKKSEILSKL